MSQIGDIGNDETQGVQKRDRGSYLEFWSADTVHKRAIWETNADQSPMGDWFVQLFALPVCPVGHP